MMITNEPPNCIDFCENILIFCIRDYNSAITEGEISSFCPTREVTGVLGMNDDNLTFAVGQPFLQRLDPLRNVVPNPVQLHGTMWTVSL